jgi:LPS export ABC transporter protein LptC
LQVRFFNELGEQNSSLVAEYALQMVAKNLWEARGDVVVINSKGEQLNTEKLFWDSRKEIIYSDEFVKITTPEQVIMGEGFTADQNFEEYEINRPTGTINIDDNA